MTLPHNRRLMCILAHPDDETLGLGSTLAKYADQGVEIHLLTATRGERGWHEVPPQYPGPQEMGHIREQELRAAAEILGVCDVRFLDYIDGDLDQAPPAEIIPRIVAHVRRVRPQVVITFAPDGAYGHPDHIAISQFTTAALVVAADPTYTGAGGGKGAHRVAKLYYFAETVEVATLYSDLVGGLVMEVDGVQRRFDGWQPWAVTTHIDGDAYWRDVRRAIHCHETQRSTLGTVEDALETHHALLLGMRHYYRAYSLVNGGRQVETDLFEGLDLNSEETRD
jgi:LmbE family N-acetylglucosaminyl deacetylase